MKILSKQEADNGNYYSITRGVNPMCERAIVDSMERAMRGVDACWIRFSEHHVELGRKRGTVHLLTRKL